MTAFLQNNIQHILCALLLLSRITDIASTWLVSPQLKMEANPIAAKLGWPFALLTTLVCVLPYFAPEIAAGLIPAFFLVSAGNLSKVWVSKTMGEDAYFEQSQSLVIAAEWKYLIISIWGGCLLLLLTGLTLFLLLMAQVPTEWLLYFSFGIILYGLVAAFYSTLFFLKHKKQRATDETSSHQTKP